jgi:predicted PurR-regulated permease PerM
MSDNARAQSARAGEARVDTTTMPGAPLLLRVGALSALVLATIACAFLLRAAAQLFIPIVLAMVISYALEPAVLLLVRRRVSRWLGTCLVMGSVLGTAGLGAYGLRDELRAALESLPEFMTRTREWVAAQSRRGLGADIREAAAVLHQQVPAPAPSSGGVAIPVPALVQRGAGSVIALAGHATVVTFLVFFMLASGQHCRTRLVEAAGPDPVRMRTVARIVDDINAQIQRFLLVRAVTAMIVAGLTWSVLAWMGVAHAAVWGLLAGVFNSIPYVGPIIVSGGLFLVGLIDGGGSARALQMAGVALIITTLEGWLLTPLLIGKAQRMSALAVFIGLLFWTWIWGGWGTILAVPMLVVIKAVADHVPSMRPLGRLMAP